MDSTNYCRSDETLGNAVRFLLSTDDETNDGKVSDWDIPSEVWNAVAVELEAFLVRHQAAIDELDISKRDLGEWWIGARNGEGIGFTDYYTNIPKQLEMLREMQRSARSQGQCRIYIGEWGLEYLPAIIHGDASKEWGPFYEAARKACGYA